MSFEIWTQRNGTRIRVSDMDDPHVWNTRNMMQRNLEKWSKLEREDPHQWQRWGKVVDRCLGWIARFEEELKRR